VISAEKSERKLEANESGVVIFDKGEVLVAASDGFVRLKNVVPAGKKEMSAADWARGMRITEADRCQ
jgi:methionyl-tRNA formyltransferase